MSTVTLFPDSNIFMHGKALSAMPWSELGGADIDLVIAYPVQRELDNHKRTGGRKGKRAREAVALMRELLELPDHIKVIREAGPRVTVRLIPALRPRTAHDDLLDLSHPDDALVNSVLAFAAQNPDADVRVLSDDTGTATTASQVGARFKLATDDWLAKPEDDPSEKQLREYKAKYDRLLAQEPEVSVQVTDGDDQEIDALRLTLRRHRRLGESEIAELLNKLTAALPMASDFGSAETDPRPDPASFPRLGRTPVRLNVPAISEYVPASEREKEKYTLKEYPDWLETVKRRLTRLHDALDQSTARPEIAFHLSNTGTRHAAQVLVEMRCHGDIEFASPLAREEEKAERKVLPLPPQPPRGHWRSASRRLAEYVGIPRDLFPSPPSFPHLDFPKGRDPNKFYWRDGRPSLPAAEWEYECAEWRHQDEPEVFSARIIVDDEVQVAEGAVQIRVRAANLSEPYERTVPVRLQFEEVDTFALASALVDDLIDRASRA